MSEHHVYIEGGNRSLQKEGKDKADYRGLPKGSEVFCKWVEMISTGDS